MRNVCMCICHLTAETLCIGVFDTSPLMYQYVYVYVGMWVMYQYVYVYVHVYVYGYM
jgi:hypothetical protein